MAGKKGPLGYVLDLAVGLVVIGGVIGVAKVNNINSVDDLYNFSKKKSGQIEECYKKKGEGCVVIPAGKGNTGESKKADNALSDRDLGYKGPKGGDSFILDFAKVKKDAVKSEADSLPTVVPNENKVNTSDFAFFSPYEGSACWSTKEEVLARQAVPNSLKFIDKDMKKTKDKAKACKITAGKWIDPYTGDTIKAVEDMDVDQVVSVKTASRQASKELTKEDKVRFANDVDSNLLAVSKKGKEKRNGASIAKYTPKNKEYKCTFTKTYVLTSSKYGIGASEKDKKVIDKIMADCSK